MEKQPSRHPKLPLGKQAWVIVLIVALVCLALCTPGYLQRRAADRTVELLQPVVSGDARFSRLRVWRSEDHAVVGGIVSSKADAAAVKDLVFHAQPTQDIVRVDFILEIAPGLR